MNRKILAIVFNVGLLTVSGINAGEGKSWWSSFFADESTERTERVETHTTTPTSTTDHKEKTKVVAGKVIKQDIKDEKHVRTNGYRLDSKVVEHTGEETPGLVGRAVERVKDVVESSENIAVRGYNATKSGVRYATSKVADSISASGHWLNDVAFKGSRKYWTIGLPLAALAVYKLYNLYLENKALEAELEEEGFYEEEVVPTKVVKKTGGRAKENFTSTEVVNVEPTSHDCYVTQDIVVPGETIVIPGEEQVITEDEVIYRKEMREVTVPTIVRKERVIRTQDRVVKVPAKTAHVNQKVHVEEQAKVTATTDTQVTVTEDAEVTIRD
jgi:hypothetical protein